MKYNVKRCVHTYVLISWKVFLFQVAKSGCVLGLDMLPQVALLFFLLNGDFGKDAYDFFLSESVNIWDRFQGLELKCNLV